VSLNVNHEEHVHRALADTGASSSIILEAYTFKNLIKEDKDNKTPWSTMCGQLTTEKTGLMHFYCQNLTSSNKFLGSFMLMTNQRHQTHME
jgi:hypothetical protein